MTRNGKVALICSLVFFGMVGAAYASVPLYRLFCQVTGFDGTVRKADKAPAKVLDRKISIRFDTNVRGLPWDFKAEQVSQELRIGETGLAFFKVTNNSNRAIVGRAAYNVVPESAGAYFQKLECFCFSDQGIKAGETKEFPMAYFVDPKLASDPETKVIKEITLSYTFYPVENPKAVTTTPVTASHKPAGGVSALGEKPKAGL
jgi:cytochrome c oxidase assembly protein subunit 11